MVRDQTSSFITSLQYLPLAQDDYCIDPDVCSKRERCVIIIVPTFKDRDVFISLNLTVILGPSGPGNTPEDFGGFTNTSSPDSGIFYDPDPTAPIPVFPDYVFSDVDEGPGGWGTDDDGTWADSLCSDAECLLGDEDIQVLSWTPEEGDPVDDSSSDPVWGEQAFTDCSDDGTCYGALDIPSYGDGYADDGGAITPYEYEPTCDCWANPYDSCCPQTVEPVSTYCDCTYDPYCADCIQTGNGGCLASPRIAALWMQPFLAQSSRQLWVLPDFNAAVVLAPIRRGVHLP